MADQDWGFDHKPGWTYTYEDGWIPPKEEEAQE